MKCLSSWFVYSFSLHTSPSPNGSIILGSQYSATNRFKLKQSINGEWNYQAVVRTRKSDASCPGENAFSGPERLRRGLRSTWTEAALEMWLHFHFSRLVITRAEIQEKHNQPSPTRLCGPWSLVSSSVDGEMVVG